MNGFDLTTLHFLNDFAHRSPRFDAVVTFLAYGNLFKGQVFALLLVWFWFAKDTAQQRRREIILATILAALVALVVARALAGQLPFRLRPIADPSLALHAPFGDRYQELEGWSAFPSDHAMLFAALATGLLFVSRRVGVAAHVYWIVLIGLPRVYLGLHYPTDIVAGALLGTFICWAANVLRVRTPVTSLALRWQRARPAAFYVGFFFVCMQIAVMFIDLRTALHGIAVALRGDQQVAAQLGRAAGNGHRVLERLYQRPILSVGDVREITGATNPAANQLVARLVDHGVLTEVTGQRRHRRFQYSAYVRLFDESGASGRR